MKQKKLIILLLTFITLLYSDNKNKIGIVLSGGGVKGMGHIGTLQLIDSLNIPVDFIVGTSIGSIAAGLYASGYSADEIEQLSFNTYWDEIFNQNRRRNHLYFFQKANANSHQLSFEINGFKPTPPLGLTNGQYSYQYLSNLFNVYNGTNNFNDLHIPFRCNAVDLITGDEIIFESGSIATAIRASTSIPTIFSPIEYNNYLLIDGGMKNNFPVDIVKSMGADFVIGVNVGSEHKNKDDIKSVLDIISATFSLSNKDRTKNNIDLTDILIEPLYDNINSIDFDNTTMKRLNNYGKKTAYLKINELLQLHDSLSINSKYLKLSALKNHFRISLISLDDSIDDSFYITKILNPYLGKHISKKTFINLITEIRNLKKYRNLHYKFKKNRMLPSVSSVEGQQYELYIKAEALKPLILNNILIKGNEKLSHKFLESIFDYTSGDTLSINDLENKIQGAYTSDYFKHIFYEVQKVDDTYYNLIIDIKENNFKRLYVGAIWDNYYKLIGKLKLELLNKPATNFKIHNQLYFSGIRKNIFSISYGINKNNIFIISPFISVTKAVVENKRLFKENYTITSIGLNFPLKQYGNILIQSNREKNLIETYRPSLRSTWNYDDTQEYSYKFNSLNIDIDQLDNILIPKQGYQIIIDYEKGQNLHYSLEKYKLNYYHTFKFDHTLRVYSFFYKSYNAPFYKNYLYGGYNWLPGYNEFDLSSDKLLSVGLEYQIHYKSSTTFKFFINKIPQYTSDDINIPLSYGIGITLKSILGPLNFIWARGIKEPQINMGLDNHIKQNIFYFNFGVTY